MHMLTAAVDKHRQLILDAHSFIWEHPETGYREHETSRFMENAFMQLGYDITRAGDIPGFYTVIDTGRPGPEILVFGELDSLICAEHPEARPVTGAVHCCGHSAQCAALLGIAAALKEPGVLDTLCGKIRLCAVPAEEMIEIEFRQQLKREGRIHYMGGKTEFLYRGYFDTVDMALMVHTTTDPHFSITAGSVGFMTKRIRYKGVSAHAGGCPWEGCNALYAATLGLNAVNALRETFKEPDMVRVHPIITKGGGVVNAIPDMVELESYVRAGNLEALRDTNRRVNRALCGAALSLGANIDIQDEPGYAPLRNCEGMTELACEAIKHLPGAEIRLLPMNSTSTDMGDISSIMPAIQPYAPGATGKDHGTNYRIANPELACVDSAKWQLIMLAMLLKDDAARAKKIIAEFKPFFAGKDEYFRYMASLASEGERIVYDEQGNARVNIAPRQV